MGSKIDSPHTYTDRFFTYKVTHEIDKIKNIGTKCVRQLSALNHEAPILELYLEITLIS
jgi:hypothetical protein